MSTHVAASRSTSRKRGFTVIEMIIVLVIIGVLAALLYPVFSRTHCESRRPACASNLKQLGLAMAQYTSDYNQRYPRLTSGSNGSGFGNSITWRRIISDYMRNEELWKCRANKTLNEKLSPYDNLTLSYDVADCGPIRRDRSTPETDVKSPAQTILVFEENGFNPQSQENGVPWDADDGDENWTNILYAGHLGTSNYLYADSHVKSLTPIKTIANGINQWHLNVGDAVSSRAREKLLAATRNFR